jgi:hypothetical protein
MKSDRLMPSRADRAFNVLCTCSGTSLTWIIFDMFQAPGTVSMAQCHTRYRLLAT